MAKKEAVLLKIDPSLARALRVRAAEERTTMSAIVERALRKELGDMANRDEFARHLGYASWDDLLAASETVAVEGDTSWYITRLPDGRWAAWDDAELAPDRVTIHDSREAALRYQWEGWQDAGGDSGDRVQWLAAVPMTVQELVSDLWDRGRDLLAADGTPVDDMALDTIGRDRLATVRYYDRPEPLVDADGVIHPALRIGNANWRSASVAWDEHRAMIWGEAKVDGQTYYIVGEPEEA